MNGDAIAVVPARGGSKGIPRKNVRPFLGRPLLAWTIDAARESGLAVVVSTDDEEVAEVARSCGVEVPFLRPSALAGDEVPTAPVVRHALEQVSSAAELVLVLEPTAPSRRPQQIREALEVLERSGADSLASVSRVPYHHTAEKQLRLEPDGALAGLDGTPVGAMKHRRQDVEPTYAFNGLVWGCRREIVFRDPPSLWGERVVGYVVDPRYAVDLDRLEDWGPAEARVRELLAEGR